MKNFSFKKLLAVALVLMMTLAAVVPMMAAGETSYTITLNPNNYTDVTKTDRYQAYQVFTGRLTQNDADGRPVAPGTDASRQLADPQWGCDIDVEGLLTDLAESTDPAFGTAFASVTTRTTAKEIVEILGEQSNNSAFVKAFAKVVAANVDACDKPGHPAKSEYTPGADGALGTFTVTVDEPGYYLIVDDANSSNGYYDEAGDTNTAAHDVMSEYMLEVLGNQTMNVKSDAPTVDKELLGDASYEIGEEVTYRLTGTVAENFKAYEHYIYNFVDTMSDGLTLDASSIRVYIAAKAAPETALETFRATRDYTVSTSGETVIRIEFADLIKAIENVLYADKFSTATHCIVVEYKATVNDKAVVAEAETNSVKLEYSNDPKIDGDGKTGTAPGPEVYVYTFGVEFHKVDSSKYDDANWTTSGLEGVEFKLYKAGMVKNPEYRDGEENDGIDEYIPGYVYATVTNGADGKYLVDNDNWTTEAAASVLVTGDYGKLVIEGLAEGEYYLKETTPADGFDTMEDIYIKVEASYYTAADEALDATHVAGTLKGYKVTTTSRTLNDVVIVDNGEITSGDYKLDLLNTPATSLPKTGGMGTRMFYIGGGVLLAVAAAALVLVVTIKKRREN